MHHLYDLTVGNTFYDWSIDYVLANSICTGNFWTISIVTKSPVANARRVLNFGSIYST